ncbi:MAG: hypothetical protein Q4B94_08120 [Pseudomonadota bacterium]|nr:hypothetical protein [Pseudomonadota bacterium]
MFAAACALLFAFSPARAGDVLLLERIKQESASPQPARGMSMAEVERRFGAPQSRLEPRGGQKRQWPTIHRWVYADYTVYFERSRVVDVVLNQASPQEAGPKPPVR